MNEFDKRARMLSDRVPKLGILQEITNYLDWVFCHRPTTSCATLQLERPIGKSSALCLQMGISLRVEEGIFLGIQSCLEGSRAAAFRTGRMFGG